MLEKNIVKRLGFLELGSDLIFIFLLLFVVLLNMFLSNALRPDSLYKDVETIIIQENKDTKEIHALSLETMSFTNVFNKNGNYAFTYNDKTSKDNYIIVKKKDFSKESQKYLTKVHFFDGFLYVALVIVLIMYFLLLFGIM